MNEWDFRLTPARPDLAAAHLRGLVAADAYVEGRTMQVVTGVADLRRAPSHDSLLDTQALFGQEVTVYEDYEGWGWVQLARDSYVGYMPMSALADGRAMPTHRVAVSRTFVYQCPDIKLSARRFSPLGAAVRVQALEGLFAQIGPNAFVFADHLRPCSERENDFVAVAERFLHVPYLWGGKTSLGIDCSGLVQISLNAAGITAPRDSDLQEKALGKPLAIEAELVGLQRGDLVFWRGHVGIMQDEANLLHANAHHMLVVSETLRIARERILAQTSKPISAIKRLTPTARELFCLGIPNRQQA
jgi:dipeptidyl peptidase-like protein/NlpC/P60 family protein